MSQTFEIEIVQELQRLPCGEFAEFLILFLVYT